MKAEIDGQVIAESDDIVQCDGYAYFPAASVKRELLEKVVKTDDDHACPHGVQFYDVVLEGKRHSRVSWSYEAPRPHMQQTAHRFGFWKGVKVG